MEITRNEYISYNTIGGTPRRIWFCNICTEAINMLQPTSIGLLSRKENDMLEAKIQASKDGLWLHCFGIEGVHESINLLMPDKNRKEQILNQLWQKLYNELLKLGINHIANNRLQLTDATEFRVGSGCKERRQQSVALDGQVNGEKK